MIKCGDGKVILNGDIGRILGETTDILRGVRETLEEHMSKEEADKWIGKVVRRSAMTKKEEVLDTIRGAKEEAKELKKALSSENEEDNDYKKQDKEPMPDFLGMLLDALLSDDGKDQEE